MGIDNEKDREAIMESARNLPCKIHQQQSTCLNINNNNNNNNNITETPEKCGDGDDEEKSTATDSAENEGHDDDESAVDRWLTSIRLGVYKETFRKHLYTDMERVRRIWEVELTAVLEIQRVGHRKRILASVSGHQSHGSHGPNIEDINADLNLLVSLYQPLCYYSLSSELNSRLCARDTPSVFVTQRFVTLFAELAIGRYPEQHSLQMHFNIIFLSARMCLEDYGRLEGDVV